MPEEVNNSDISKGGEAPGVINNERELTPQEREIKGVWEAIHFVDKVAKSKRSPIGEDVIKSIHRRVMKYYHPEVVGRYRDYEVAISGAIFLPPHWSQVKELMWKFGNEADGKCRELTHSLGDVENVINVGAWVHYQLVKIHPFADGNGRTSRLTTDLIFKRGGLYYIQDWGDPDKYTAVLKRVDESGNLGFFSRFLAGRLAERYAEVAERLKGERLRGDKSPVLSDLYDKRCLLGSISSNPNVRLRVSAL